MEFLSMQTKCLKELNRSIIVAHYDVNLFPNLHDLFISFFVVFHVLLIEYL